MPGIIPDRNPKTGIKIIIKCTLCSDIYYFIGGYTQKEAAILIGGYIPVRVNLQDHLKGNIQDSIPDLAFDVGDGSCLQLFPEFKGVHIHTAKAIGSVGGEVSDFPISADVDPYFAVG